MTTRPRFILPILFLVASIAFPAPLMHRAQTVISVPERDKQEPLYGLAYKARSFEAKISAVTLKVTSADGADPVVGEWTFLGTNSDGQLHKVEIHTRLLDESGSQVGIASKACMLGGGYKDFPCTVPLNVKASVWQATKSIRIVTDWQS